VATGGDQGQGDVGFAAAQQRVVLAVAHRLQAQGGQRLDVGPGELRLVVAEGAVEVEEDAAGGGQEVGQLLLGSGHGARV